MLNESMTESGRAGLDPQRAPCRILIVEDDLCLKTVLSRILSSIRREATLRWVTNAEDALAELKEGAFQLIVADYILPGKASGLDLWKHCRREHAQTPFLMTSGLAVGDLLTTDDRKCVVPRFLLKPFRVQECQAILESILRKGTLAGR